jgi:GNAT superfamily N-acetyltransferase
MKGIASMSFQLTDSPPASRAGTPTVEVREALPADFAAVFRDLLLAELPAHYDEVDDTFPRSILENAAAGRDPFGYFTLRKCVYTAYVDGVLAGFTVVSLKRGGSAKIGPTAVLSTMRRTGVATALRDVVEKWLYDEYQVRKLYMTVSASNLPALLFNLGRGFQIEGVLRGQYRRDADEYVLGTFRPGASPVEPDAQPAPRIPLQASMSDVHTEVVVDPSHAEVEGYLEPRLAPYFGGLDQHFYRAIVAACHDSRQSYQYKGKRLLVSRSADAVVAMAVYVPKRGGGVKLSPCVADDRGAARHLLTTAVDLAATDGRRKVYVHVPDQAPDLVTLLAELGFVIEAQLREAYKPGVDMLVAGRLLT